MLPTERSIPPRNDHERHSNRDDSYGSILQKEVLKILRLKKDARLPNHVNDEEHSKGDQNPPLLQECAD